MNLRRHAFAKVDEHGKTTTAVMEADRMKGTSEQEKKDEQPTGGAQNAAAAAVKVTA